MLLPWNICFRILRESKINDSCNPKDLTCNITLNFEDLPRYNVIKSMDGEELKYFIQDQQ